MKCYILQRESNVYTTSATSLIFMILIFKNLDIVKNLYIMQKWVKIQCRVIHTQIYKTTVNN